MTQTRVNSSEIADVTSVDPLTRASISLTIAPDGVRGVTPETTVVSGDAWTAQHPGTFLQSVEDAFALGQLTNARNFGEALGRPTC